MAILTGLMRIGRDVEVRFTNGGESVANLSLAYNYGRKGDDGKRPTAWVEASLWGKRAESLAPYLKKGGLVDVVLGEPHVETYEGKHGTGHKLAARVLEIELAGGGERQDRNEGERDNAQYTKAPARHDVPDDDVPF